MNRSESRGPAARLAAAALLLVILTGAAAFAGARGGAAPEVAQAQNPTPAPTEVPVGGRIQADNACYVRLPDLPFAPGRYGGFGGYNPDTGVLTFAGGAEKRTEEQTIAFYQLYGLRLDGVKDHWSTIPYSDGGYLRQADRGCREMGTLQLSASRWLSVLGRDGCDGTSRRRGELRELVVGDTADADGVRWRNSKIAGSVPNELEQGSLRLIRMFTAYDHSRDRVIFGQGTFDDEKDQATQDEVYAARSTGGTQWVLSQLRPGGAIPTRRFGSCAAYVHDAATGLDGVIVVGGQEGGPKGVSATTYKEVWWLDFSESANGRWVNITGRFANMDDFGGRREGACAYNPDTKQLYHWFGRGSSSIPDGASRTTGLWRVDLSQLGDTAAPLTWERLAKDNTAGLAGRRAIPSVYDWRQNRLFVMGGRGGSEEISEFNEVWALYPEVTGEACANLDPYAPFRPGAPTPTGSPPVPTVEPPTPTPVPATPSLCPGLDQVVPQAAINAAMANPASVNGWGQLCNPSLPAGPSNTLRSNLSLQTRNKPWHPLFNSLVFKCGCP